MKPSSSALALATVAALSALGVILARTIPASVFPEVTFRRAIVLADSGDLPAAQMLVSVTRPLEQAAYSVPGVTMVRSITTRGGTEIDVLFSEDTDPESATHTLNAAVSEARSSIPLGVKTQTRLLTTGTFPILSVSISSRDRSLAELTDIANGDLIPALNRIAGTYRVGAVGAKYREFVVRLDPARLGAHHLGPADVAAALARDSVIASPGRINDSHRMMLAVVSSAMTGAAEIEDAPIATLAGQPLRVRDVGSVELGIVEDYIRTSSESGASILVDVGRRPSGNTIEIARQARAILAGFRDRYSGVNFSVSYDQSALVEESAYSVRDAIALGLALAVLVVLAFMTSLVSAAIAAVVVPCTVCITAVLIKAAGGTFNMMTLGGLAAGIGLFIDDAIVMIEAIHASRAAGADTPTAVAEAVSRLARPLVASTATVAVVFVPFIFISGVTGAFFRALAVSLGGGLAISLALAMWFTPALEVALEPLRRVSRAPGPMFGLVRRAYAVALAPFVRVPALAIVVAAASIGAAYGIFRGLGSDYLPPLDEGAFVLDYLTPPESTMDDTAAMLAKIEDVLKSTPEVAAFSRRTGTQLGFFLTESNRGDISVRLKADRQRSIGDVMESIRARIAAGLPAVHVEFSQMLQDLLGDLAGNPAPIEIKVFGPDSESIRATAARIANEIKSIPGFVDVFNGLTLSLPERRIVVAGGRAARFGLSAEDIRAALDAIIQGTVAANVISEDRIMGVRVGYPNSFHRHLSVLSEVTIRSAAGEMIPLDAIASMTTEPPRPEIERERQRPVVRVTARLEGVDLGGAVAAARAKLARIAMPPGVSVEFGGLFAQQAEAFDELTVVMIFGIVAMFLIVVWEFGRFAPALATIVAAMASLAGSLAALAAAGATLNISSFMGIIMVVGITAKNGIILLDRAENLRARGESAARAILDAAATRLRPIAMTTIATAAGLAPLALGLGAGARVQQPLAIAVIGGLAFAMIASTPIASGIYLIGTRDPAQAKPPTLI
jgi:multidrug efflux pump subunit AcrB